MNRARKTAVAISLALLILDLVGSFMTPGGDGTSALSCMGKKKAGAM